MIQLEGTVACMMRDELCKAKSNKEITYKEITDKMCKLELPGWLRSQILQMVNFRKHDRITCPVEQAMEAAVCYKIICDIRKEETI